MTNIPALSEKDLGDTIGGEFAIPVTLVSPDGTKIDTTADGKPLAGFVRRGYTETRELRKGETDKVIVNAPCVKLRITALAVIPATGEKWLAGIPQSPLAGAGLEWFDLNPKKPVEVNAGRGTVKLFLSKMQGGTNGG